MAPPRTLRLFLLALTFTVNAASASAPHLFSDFSTPPTVAHGVFDSPTITLAPGALRIETPHGRGGLITRESLDLSRFAAWTPRLHLTLHPEHQSNTVRLFLDDASGQRRSFTFNLRRVERGSAVDVLANDAATLSSDDPESPFDLSSVAAWQFQGAWNAQPHALTVHRIEFVPPSSELLALRTAAASRRAAEAARTAAQAEDATARLQRLLREGAARPADGPEILDLAPVSPRVLAFTLRDREAHSTLRAPYLPAAGDRLIEGRTTAPAWTPEGIREVPKETRLRRAGSPTDAGFLYTTLQNPAPHLWAEQITGTALDLTTVEQPRAYFIRSADDFRYSTPVHPVAIARKSKPANSNDITGEKVLTHRLYLTLPHDLVEGAHYEVSFFGLNTRERLATFTHAPRTTVNEALHVNHLGYRPDDPFKRAFLSLWTGSGAGLTFQPESFELIDTATGKSVFTAPVSEKFPASRPEGFRTARNFVGADVHYLDFHAFSTPGEYRVHVPGLGVSLPFRIHESDTWAAAFRTSMHGFLSHRSGLELGPPFSDYRRPRNMHPADGFKVFKLPVTMLEGEADNVKRAILAKIESGVPPDQWPSLPDAWGGYMDAGDWDRRSQHLSASRHLAELFSINPAFFEKLPLALPPGEATDSVPDLLNEVAWNVAFYRRLQDPDGGVRGGVESTDHPRPGEASWEESLVLGVFAPDPFSSYSYASTAALLSRLLQPYDPAEAAAYATSARRAWDWAESHATRVLDEAEARSAALPPGTSRAFNRSRAERQITEMRFVAAGDLFALTGESAFHQLFRSLAASATTEPDELGALFRYARLPAEKTDPAFRTQAIARITRQADIALTFGQANAFGLHTQAPNIPIMGYTGFYSVPEMVSGPVLPRAHALTGDERYLRGALHAAHYSAGANPLNMTFTTGVGHHYPKNPLHIDSRVTGQKPPVGITIYGPMDASADFGFNNWVHTWHLQDMVPGSRTWPAAEWHVDLFRWPAMSEYTIHQTFRPTAYYWGYLAARP